MHTGLHNLCTLRHTAMYLQNRRLLVTEGKRWVSIALVRHCSVSAHVSHTQSTQILCMVPAEKPGGSRRAAAGKHSQLASCCKLAGPAQAYTRLHACMHALLTDNTCQQCSMHAASAAALQGKAHLVQLAHELGHRVGGVQRLVGVHVAGAVGVAGHLPPGAVDGLQAAAHLHATQGAFGTHVLISVRQRCAQCMCVLGGTAPDCRQAVHSISQVEGRMCSRTRRSGRGALDNTCMCNASGSEPAAWPCCR